MALIPYPAVESLSNENQRILESMPLNLVRMLTGLGSLLPSFMEITRLYSTRGVIPPPLRELVTLRIAHRTEARYVFTQHESIARAVGVSGEQTAAVLQPLPSSIFSDAENAALMLADDLVFNTKAEPAHVLSVETHLGRDALHELLLVIGIYLFLARYSESLQVDLDVGDAGRILDATVRGM